MGQNLRAFLYSVDALPAFILNTVNAEKAPRRPLFFNKRYKVSPAARTAELNQATVSQLKRFCLLMPDQEPMAQMCVEIRSR